MGVDRNINQVDEDPETHEATVSVGCPAGGVHPPGKPVLCGGRGTGRRCTGRCRPTTLAASGSPAERCAPALRNAPGTGTCCQKGGLQFVAPRHRAPGLQGDEDGHHRLEGPIDRGDGNGRVDRTRAIGVGWAEGGRRRSHNSFVSRHGRPGIVRRKSRNGAVNQAGVGPSHLLGSQPQPVHDPGPEVLDHHIGALYEGIGQWPSHPPA